MTRYWKLLVVAMAAACGSPDATPSAPLGEIIGRIEIDQDVPEPNCRVLIEGTPRGAKCDLNGQFEIRALDPGKWDLRIIADQVGAPVLVRKITTAANPGLITDVGAIRIAKPGRIGGHIAAPPGVPLPFIVISVPRFGVATSPDPTTLGYLLERVPPGVHEVAFTTATGADVREMITVRPDET